MRRESNDGFMLAADEVRRDILVPRYYDPRIAAELESLAETHRLISIGDAVKAGYLRHDHGSYIPKIHYGTGPIPYVRTSDIANWEIKASPKHGIPQTVYEAYRDRQDVRPDDILFVHEGTYLIGSAAMVTSHDGPLLYQHHLARFRVCDGSPFSSYFFLAAIESPIVQRQIRSKQFTADTIDSVVGRVAELVIPVPRDASRETTISRYTRGAVLGRAQRREQVSYVLRTLDPHLRGRRSDATLDSIFQWTPTDSYQGETAFLRYRSDYSAFTLTASEVRDQILIPKYYDPKVATLAEEFSDMCDVVSIGDLVADGAVSVRTGDEIGKMSYGTGEIPFVRTSDLASWELKRETKQGVSEAVLGEWQDGQDVEPLDILLIRDGTYLVGSSVLVFPDDLPLLYCGGIYKLRALRSDRLDAGLLFTLLNLPFVRRQMRNKQFTRDVIDTLGKRLLEVFLPIPKDAGVRKQISREVMRLVRERDRLRHGLDAMVRTMYSPQEEFAVA